jgi:4-amino-4-deoxy-L-arabinose transferase-like glycosyltransferase
MAKKKRKTRKTGRQEETPLARAEVKPGQESAQPREEIAVAAKSYAPIQAQDWLIPALLALAYLFTRLVNVTAVPVLYDEASYLHWGKIIAGDWSQRFLAAAWGGKQPLHTWLIALFNMVFPDPILAGRMLSVLAGGISALLVWLIARRLFSRRVAHIAAFLYIITPYHLLYDRVAMIDSLLAAEALAVFLFSVRLLDRPVAWNAAGLALSIGATLLTKSSGLLFLALIPTVAILYADQREVLVERAKRCAVPLLAAGVTGYLIYFVVFGSTEGVQLVAQLEANVKYALSLDEVMAMPWDVWGRNLSTVFKVFWLLLTPPICILVACAVLASPRLGKETLLLSIWGLLPTLGFVVVGSVFYSSYLLFVTPFLLIAGAGLLERLYTIAVARLSLSRSLAPVVGGAALAALSLFPATQSYLALFNPASPAFTAIDRGIYTDAFYGLVGMSEYLKEQAQKEDIYVCVNRTFGPVQDGIFLYLEGEPHVKLLVVTPYEGRLVAYDPAAKQIYPRDVLQQRPTFLAGYDEEAEAKDFLGGHIELVEKFPSLTGQRYVALYRVKVDTAFQ